MGKEGAQPSFEDIRFRQAMEQSDAQDMALPNETVLYQPDVYPVTIPNLQGQPTTFYETPTGEQRAQSIPIFVVQQQEQQQQQSLSDERSTFSGMRMKPNQVRHSENLHGNGKPGVNGLTGFYHGQFYDRGIPMKSSEKGGEKK